MNINQQFLDETFVKYFQLISQNNKTSDLLGSLARYFDEDRADRREIHRKLDVLQNTTDEIKTKTEEIDSKMDIALEKLNVIENAFLDLKKENRDLEEKITLMNSKLSRLEVRDEEFEDYYALAQSLYMNWEDFDLLTKNFLPLAEYLYSKLQKYEKPDYSPVILELCRAIENEFLMKVFTKYTLDLLDRKGEDLDVFLFTDKSSEDLKNKTASFAKTVSNAKNNRKPTFTLGQMNIILSMTKSTKTVLKSPLLQDFVEFLNNNTEASNLLDDRYIKKIDDIVTNYRNPSAHPEYMTLEKANECREIMPERLDYLIDCLAI